jgi:enoyl-CoA hydratase/carnithine racemase
LIRGRATGNGSELTLACDMSFASREKAIFSQWEVGVGTVAGGGPMARLQQVMGRNRAMEVLLSSQDIYGDQAEAYGYVNRTLPDAELDAHVDALATRISAFDKWAIANTKRLVQGSVVFGRKGNTDDGFMLDSRCERANSFLGALRSKGAAWRTFRRIDASRSRVMVPARCG